MTNSTSDTPPDADPVGTARASLPHDRTLLFHRSFLDTQMLPFTYPRLDTSTVSTTDYPSAVMYRLFIQKDFSTRFQFLSIVDCLGQSRDAYLHWLERWGSPFKFLACFQVSIRLIPLYFWLACLSIFVASNHSSGGHGWRSVFAIVRCP